MTAQRKWFIAVATVALVSCNWLRTCVRPGRFGGVVT